MKKQSPTNELTQRIIKHLFTVGVYSWRQNVLPVPMVRDGVVTGFRSGGKSGLPDIMGILPPNGKLLCFEVKTGRDRLRPEQIGFHATVRKLGGLVFVVKTWEDYLEKISTVIPPL